MLSLRPRYLLDRMAPEMIYCWGKREIQRRRRQKLSSRGRESEGLRAKRLLNSRFLVVRLSGPDTRPCRTFFPTFLRISMKLVLIISSGGFLTVLLVIIRRARQASVCVGWDPSQRSRC